MAVTIPETADELRELLENDEQREAVFASAETTKDFLNAYRKATDKTGEITQQITDQVTASITEMMQNNGATDRPDQSALSEMVHELVERSDSGKIKTGAERNAAYNKAAPGAALDGVVNSLGEMARLVNTKVPKTDQDLEKIGKITSVRNAYSTSDPASAGFLVPEQVRSDILQIALEQAVVRPRATVITMSSLTQKIPYVDSTSNASSVYGGMVFYWTEESASITATEAKFGRVELSAKKLTGGARVPNELWNDASALQSWLMMAVPAGIAFYEDKAFFDGDGVGEPLGINNANAVVAVTRTTADEIESADIYNMYARMLPQSLDRAVWVANQETLPQLFSLSHVIKNVAGAENVGGSQAGLVSQGNIAGSPSMTILGRPLIITEKAKALGTQGDINFVDWSHYLIGDRQAIALDASEHSRFMNDETELRVIERVDGRPWLQTAITPANGSNTLSPYVQLAAG